MLSDLAIKSLTDSGYSKEEINGINQGLLDIENGDVIPFEAVVKRIYKDKSITYV